MLSRGWALDAGLWLALWRECEAREWGGVALGLEFEVLVPSRAGVYLITSNPPNHLHAEPFTSLCNVLYAGQASVSIRTRFRAHCTNSQPGVMEVRHCFDAKSLRFWWSEESSASTINRMEALLIDCFGPPANRQRGRGARLMPGVPAG